MFKNRPKITVCILTFNHGQYIDDCIASVLGQRVDADLEILVGDDFSGDGTRSIISEYAAQYPSLVFPVFHEKNIGVCPNYLSLVGKATGDYIAHLDGDDFWLPGKLAKQLDFLKRWDGCSAVWSNAIVISEHGQLIGRFNGEIAEHFDINYLVERGNFLNHSSIMYRSVCKENILGINADFIDYYVCMLLTEHGSLGYINSPLVVYRHGSTSSVIKNNLSFVRLLNWQAILCARSMGADNTYIARGISEFYGSILSSTVKQGKFLELWYWSVKIFNESQSILAGSFVGSVAKLPIRVIRSKLRKLARRLVFGGIKTLFNR